MITRPLDLASRLRPQPRSYDWLFYVNVGLIVLFFGLFGSRYVLSPGLGADFQLPAVEGANANARVTTHVIKVVNAGQILAGDGWRSVEQLPEWLEQQARGDGERTLLIAASAQVPSALLVNITAAAKQAGFRVQIAATDTVPVRAPVSAP